jgi:hypothetical protein
MVAQPWRQPGRPPGQERRGRVVLQRPDPQDRQVRMGYGTSTRPRALACGDHQADRVVLDPLARESQSVGRRLVDPLAVIDEAQQRSFGRQLGQQRERGEPDQEPVGPRGGAHAERAAERGGLRSGQHVDPVQDVAQEEMKGGVGQLGLVLDARDSQYAYSPRGRSRRIFQQRRLADSGLTQDHERPAHARPHVIHQLVDERELRVSPKQHASDLTARLPDTYWTFYRM